MEFEKSTQWLTATMLAVLTALFALFLAPSGERVPTPAPMVVFAPAAQTGDSIAIAESGAQLLHGLKWNSAQRRFEPQAGGTPPVEFCQPVSRRAPGNAIVCQVPATRQSTPPQPHDYRNDPVRAGPAAHL